MQRPAQSMAPVPSLTLAAAHGVAEVMDRLLAVPGIHGARLIHKQDGLVLERGAAYGSPETFCLFASTIIGGGDFLVGEAGIRGDVRVSIKTDETRFHLAGVTDDLFLAVVADNTMTWAPLRVHVNHARSRLREMLARAAGGWTA